MIENLPHYITIVFILSTLFTFVMFFIAIKNSSLGHKTNIIGIITIAYLVLHAVLSYNLFYLNTVADLPPKFPLLSFIPLFGLMIYLFNNEKGRVFIDSLSMNTLTWISVVRIPVEMVLFWLFVHNTLPELLTFEGRNFDILAGITAPVIAYFGIAKGNLSRQVILVWNIICAILLTNIVIMASLSFPTAIQLLSLDRPNVGLLYFPFFWLPAFIVPVVYFAHFVSIRQLTRK